ncbi:MAG: Gfo/Idh/MocA family oxidoreductase [Actinomycetota bacterium]|nr:Gfo/Idh/MocA family oxidoreductase [Actinomycetota bacterium]
MRVGMVGAGRIGAVHARTLFQQETVEQLLIADLVPERAVVLARELGAQHVESIDELFAGRIDALVVTAATSAHAGLVTSAVEAGLPVFCEKPVASTVAETLAVLDLLRRTGVELHIGFQRRFDAGFAAARELVARGELGWVHTIRAGTCDAAPPPDEYIPTSGGLFRDCSVHDIDAIRWVTGAEVREVYALGANHRDDAIRRAGDVDAAAALVTLESDTFVLLNATRYNAAGYDVRMELLGSQKSISVGLDERMPLRSVEPGVAFPTGRPWATFMERFAAAYVAEMVAFVKVAAAEMASPCTAEDALQAALVAEACELSRAEGRPVEIAEMAQLAGAVR